MFLSLHHNGLIQALRGRVWKIQRWVRALTIGRQSSSEGRKVTHRSFYIHRIGQLYSPGAASEARVSRNGTIYVRWVRAVCVPYTGGRLFAAWEVLRGRAHAFEWPKPGDLEAIIERDP